MNERRIDTLARGMGAQANRRQAIRWLAAAALAGLGWTRAASPATAQSVPGTLGDPCELVAGSCQAPYTCFEGLCDLPRGCVGEGLPCVDAFPCCFEDGLTCIDGICAIADTSLPATGIGMPSDPERAAGLALAAAAVVVAGKLIRDKERDPEL